MTRIRSLLKTSSKAHVNLPSRSRIRNVKRPTRCGPGNALPERKPTVRHEQRTDLACQPADFVRAEIERPRGRRQPTLAVADRHDSSSESGALRARWAPAHLVA